MPEKKTQEPFNNPGETETSEKDNIEALKEFLLDISCLDALSEWTNRFNLFEVLKLSRYEIRHSNLLAWLLDPNETHGLGTLFLEGFIQHALPGLENEEDVFNVLLMDFHSFNTLREWHDIDIIAVSEQEKFILCIENKFGSKEHGNQLNKYRNTILGSFPEYRKMFVFLSPDGMESSSPEFWYSMSYSEILSIIQNVTQRIAIRPEVEMLINQYMESVRSEIMGDERLASICRDIYAKHKKALDLLFENRPDRMSDIADIFKKWAKNKENTEDIILDESHSCKTNTRVRTHLLDKILPAINPETSELSAWGSKSSYYLEIHQINDTSFRIQLVLNSKNISEECMKACEKLNELYFQSWWKDGWQWRTYFMTKTRKVGDDISEESIYISLDQLWEEVKEQENKIIKCFSDVVSGS